MWKEQERIRIKIKCAHSPFVAFEIFKFNSQRVILVICQHVNVFIAEPKLFRRIAEAILIIGPITVEIFPWLAVLVAPLNYLDCCTFQQNSFKRASKTFFSTHFFVSCLIGIIVIFYSIHMCHLSFCQIGY